MKCFVKRPVTGARKAFSDAGFSLIEMIVALGVLTMVVTGAIVASRALSSTLNASVRSISDEQFMSSLELQLRRDATSSLGMMTLPASAPNNISSIDRTPETSYLPPETAANLPSPIPEPTATTDSNNLDTGVEFAVTDAQHRWHYRLQNGGLRLTQDGVTQTLDSNVSVFTAEFIPADQFANVEEMGDIFKNMPPPATYTLDLDGQKITNGVVRVKIVRGKAKRTLLLATRVTPSGFGIEAGPLWHPTVWRRGVTDRTNFGTSSQTHYEIHGAVEYTTDNWKHAKTWCDQVLFGGDNTSSENTEKPAVQLDKEHKRDAAKIFQGCQKITNSREISETPQPSPTKRACRVVYGFLLCDEK